MSRYNRAGGVFDINRSLRKTREEFERAYEDVAAVVLKNTEKGSDNMGTSNSESKRHYIADEGLGGVEREYVEIDRKADVGDYVFISRYSGESVNRIGRLDTEGIKEGSFSFEDIVGNSYGGFYLTKGRGDEFYPLSPTDIIRHNGERYRLVDRKAEVGDKVISLKGDGSIGLLAGNIYTVAKSHKVVSGHLVEVIDDQTDLHGLTEKGYRLIEPVIGGKETDAPSESQPDLIDLVIRLTRKVAELEKEISAMGEVFERREGWLEHRLSDVKKTANNADYKSGQALTTAELQVDKMEMLTDDIITLDERTQTCDCTCRRCCR